MQKGNIALVLLIVLIVLGGGALFYFLYAQDRVSQSLISSKPATSSSQLSNNKTYTSSQFGFSLAYPNNLELKEDSEESLYQRAKTNFRKNFTGFVRYEPAEMLGGVEVLGEDKNYDTNPFTIWVFNNPENLTPLAWYNKYWYFPFIWGDFTSKGKGEIAPLKDATISGQVAKLGVVSYQDGKPQFIYFSKGGKMYLFRIIGEEGQKILNSFSYSK
jgi:hypothetical protein